MITDPLWLATVWISALLIDQIWGEYPNALHPVVWMGQCIAFCQKLVLGRGPRLELLAGIGIAILIPVAFAALSYFSLEALATWPLLQALCGVFWFKASFALKALGYAAEQVQKDLAQGDLDKARFALRSLCSRNAAQLSEEELTEAAISSIAENHSDSVIAPWLFAAVFGIPGAIAYRAVNTLDAMIGYKNHFRYLGFASAKLDDLCNLLPARISALLLLLTGAWRRPLLSSNFRPSFKEAFAVARQDHSKTPSPNGGWPMAVMAGLLGIALRKTSVYTLGVSHQASRLHLIGEAWSIARRAAICAFPCFLWLALPS